MSVDVMIRTKPLTVSDFMYHEWHLEVPHPLAICSHCGLSWFPGEPALVTATLKNGQVRDYHRACFEVQFGTREQYYAKMP